MVVYIPLSKTGKRAGKYQTVVDDCDSDLAELNWSAKEGTHTVYVHRTIQKNHKQTQIRLHHAIAERMFPEIPKGMEIDHRDGNGLNNQRSNLRLATHQQNSINRKIRADNSSGVKGVSFDKKEQRWKAYIMVNGKQKTVGYFRLLDDAKKARFEAVQKYYGDFAHADDKS